MEWFFGSPRSATLIQQAKKTEEILDEAVVIVSDNESPVEPAADDFDEWIVLDAAKMPQMDSPAASLTPSAPNSMLLQSVRWDDPRQMAGFYELKPIAAPAGLPIPAPSTPIDLKVKEPLAQSRLMTKSILAQSIALGASIPADLAQSLGASQLLTQSIAPPVVSDLPSGIAQIPPALQPEWVQALLAQFRAGVDGQLGDEIREMRVVPPVLTPLQANEAFEAWRKDLWFAPTNFSQQISDPTLTLVYVPYYCVLPVTVSHIRGNLSVKGEGEWQQVTCSTTTTHETIVAYGSDPMTAEIRHLLTEVEGWDMETSIAVSNAPVSAPKQDVVIDVEVQRLTGADEIWKEVEDVIVTLERALCKDRLIAEYRARRGDSIDASDDVLVRDLSLTRIDYKEARYRVVYVPMYQVKYHNDDVYSGQRSQHNDYTFFVNAETGVKAGERPMGMGKVLGGGMRMLEGLFGIKDQDRPALISGKQLRFLDSSAAYRLDSLYLVFPQSQSYFMFSATGFITLRNIASQARVGQTEVHIRLTPHKRGSQDESDNGFLLAPGEEETFDYKGNWCMRVSFLLLTHDGKEASGDAAKLEQNDPSLGDYLVVAEVQTSGGGNYGNLLAMA